MGRLSNEDRTLLAKDLCARLPYGVVCSFGGKEWDTVVGKLTPIGLFQFMEEDLEVIPHLRPMESMTEEEAEEYFKNSEYEASECYEAGANYEPITVKAALSADEASVNTDWLNARHFDYRGLIPKGLALEAKEGDY